ncbi:MAG: hypothetical protein CTR55_07165 [Pseudomonas sp.]|nr:MAG: hypothetical protein CTR55_07165 [Pseudomonas sp.]
MGLEPELKIVQAELLQQGSSDIYRTRFYLDGGGRCQWKLNHVMLRTKYSLAAEGRTITGNLEELFVVEERRTTSDQVPREKRAPLLVIQKKYIPFITTDEFDRETLDFKRKDEWPRFSFDAIGAEAIRFEPWVSQLQGK